MRVRRPDQPWSDLEADFGRTSPTHVVVLGARVRVPGMATAGDDTERIVGCSHVYEQVSALAARLDAEGIESRACASCIRLRMPERAWATGREGRCGKGPIETTVLVDSHCDEWQACASWRDAHAAARERRAFESHSPGGGSLAASTAAEHRLAVLEDARRACHEYDRTLENTREVLSWTLDALPVFADFVAFVGRARDDTRALDAKSAAIGVAPWSAVDEATLTPTLDAESLYEYQTGLYNRRLSVERVQLDTFELADALHAAARASVPETASTLQRIALRKLEDLRGLHHLFDHVGATFEPIDEHHLASRDGGHAESPPSERASGHAAAEGERAVAERSTVVAGARRRFGALDVLLTIVTAGLYGAYWWIRHRR